MCKGKHADVCYYLEYDPLYVVENPEDEIDRFESIVATFKLIESKKGENEALSSRVERRLL